MTGNSLLLIWRADLDHTLANAPLASGERAQIYQVIENFAVTEKQKEEPETLMSARVGSIQLADDGSQGSWCKGHMLHSAALAETARCGYSLLVRKVS